MRLFLLGGLILSLAGAAVADDYRVQAPVSAVTLYPNQAEVSRSVETEMTAGTNRLIVTGLPADLQGSALRVEGERFGGELRLGSVSVRRVELIEEASPRERLITSELRSLRLQVRTLDDEIKAAQLQYDLIATLGELIPPDQRRRLAEGDFDLESLQSSTGQIRQSAEQALARIREAEVRRDDLTATIDRFERELAGLATGVKAASEALIDIELTEAGLVSLLLVHPVVNAGWQPVYEAKLDTEAGRLEMVRLAQIHQRTGERWSDISLTLAAGRPSGSTDIDEPVPWFIDAFDPEEAPRPLAEAEPDLAGRALERTAPQALARPSTAEIATSPFAASYLIAGPTTLDSGDETKRLEIEHQNLTAAVKIRTRPRVDPNAYLLAEATRTGDDPWLSGPVSLYRDGQLVGRSRLAGTAPGEKLRLGFGHDRRVEVSYRSLGGERSQGGLIRETRRHRRLFSMTVTNRHDQPRFVQVIDQVPVPRDERIEVELLAESEAPDERDALDTLGALSWSLELDGGERREVLFGYRVSHPADFVVPGFWP
ncbi:MAG: mucoidy inhibitor MuiA family protein [Geminicoccaceae bacterium]